MDNSELRERMASEIAQWFVSKMTTGLPGAFGLADRILSLLQADVSRREREAALWGWEQRRDGVDWKAMQAEAARKYPENASK